MENFAPEIDQVLPLTPTVFHILLALADQERHGYAIMQEVTAMTQNGAPRPVSLHRPERSA